MDDGEGIDDNEVDDGIITFYSIQGGEKEK